MNVQYNIPPFQPTAYYPPYRYADKKEVPTKQKAAVQETRKKKVRTFTHFNYQLSLYAGTALKGLGCTVEKS